MNELDSKTVESSELVEQTFKFWLNDNEHIRSPFPSYIHNELKNKATEQFFQWANGLGEKAKDELTEEEIGERFEEIIFEAALTLIKTEDERITILYPFLPRLGDSLNDDTQEKSEIIEREIDKNNDHSFLKIKCQRLDTNEKWETSFELPI